MIEVKSLYKSFEDKEVLKDINSVFENGKTNLIIGQSGSGKTVLMKCIVGLFRPTSGEVLYDGRDLVTMNKQEWKMLRREMGMIFQSAALFDSMTVLENVMFPLDMFSKDSYAERVKRAQFCLDRVNLLEAQKKFPDEISGGMQKRVAIARAYAVNPSVLLMDEPFGALDAQTRTQLQTELLKTETRWKWMKSLSDTANGTITGKARIMLETYIQMQYFDRILARANIRLMTMSSGQYELVRRKENKSRVGKTGLELDVVDHYNGTVRSVKTLSGGETFQASLSLALGLSDEIQSSSGGIQLDTMFVDEGFGSLDEDALDQAIRALKDLSQGSRLVGIVSHVAELKERIDKKIIVTKKRTEDGVGSAICIEG